MTNPTRKYLKTIAGKTESPIAKSVLAELNAAEAQDDEKAAMRAEITLAGALGYYMDDDE